MGELVLNQFGVTDRKGQVKNPDKGIRIEALVKGEDLVYGDCVKLAHVDGAKLPVVEKITDVSDKVFGVVKYESAKANGYKAGDMVTIARHFSIIGCEADGAINAGAEVEAVIEGGKVATKTSGTVIGIALTPALVKGDIILVELV